MSDEGLARARALRFLQERERARREVELRLARYGYGSGLISEVADWLEALGYLDDRRFARLYAIEKSQTGWGPRRIRSELLRRGVSAEIADDALEAIAAARSGSDIVGEGSDEILVTMVERRFGEELRSGQPQVAERKAGSFLARRGHDYETISRVIRAVRRAGQGVS